MKRRSEEDLEVLITRWEGGEIVDTNLLLRLLIKELRETRCRVQVDDVI